MICIARAIAAYERSKEVSSFTSKFDLMGKLNRNKRQNGLDLFKRTKPNATNAM